jgi:hypothetical protein
MVTPGVRGARCAVRGPRLRLGVRGSQFAVRELNSDAREKGVAAVLVAETALVPE